MRYVAPAEIHRGENSALLEKRDKLYRHAQKAHSECWSGKIRNWQSEGPVTLNPERENRRLKLTQGANYLDTYRLRNRRVLP